MKKLLLSSLAAMTLFAACKKDDDSSETPQTRLVGKWITTTDRSTITFNSTVATTDNYAKRNACENDDLLVFNSDNTLVRDEGATRCRSTDPQSASVGTWALLNNNAQLKLSKTAEETYDIITLTNSDLKLRRVFTSGNASQIDTVFYSKR